MLIVTQRHIEFESTQFNLWFINNTKHTSYTDKCMHVYNEMYNFRTFLVDVAVCRAKLSQRRRNGDALVPRTKARHFRRCILRNCPTLQAFRQTGKFTKVFLLINLTQLTPVPRDCDSTQSVKREYGLFYVCMDVSAWTQ